MKLENHTPTKTEKQMFASGYGLYLREKRADYGNEEDYLRYVVCYPDGDRNNFPEEIELPDDRIDEKASIEFERLTDTVKFKNIMPDVGLMDLVKNRMIELGYSPQAIAL